MGHIGHQADPLLRNADIVTELRIRFLSDSQRVYD